MAIPPIVTVRAHVNATGDGAAEKIVMPPRPTGYAGSRYGKSVAADATSSVAMNDDDIAKAHAARPLVVAQRNAASAASDSTGIAKIQVAPEGGWIRSVSPVTAKYSSSTSHHSRSAGRRAFSPRSPPTRMIKRPRHAAPAQSKQKLRPE